MKRIITKLLLIFSGLFIGLTVGYYRYKSELKKVTAKIKDILGAGKYYTFERLVGELEERLIEKEKIMNEFKVDIEKMEKKLSNLERQYSEFINYLLKQGKSRQTMMEFLSSKSADDEKLIQNIMKEINTAVENTDELTTIRLLKKLVVYGQEYYQFVFDTMKKIMDILKKNKRIDTNDVAKMNIEWISYYKEFSSVEFIDFYKWVFENPDVEKEYKIGILGGLVWAGGEGLKPYLFEQFWKHKDIEIKEKLFLLLSGCVEYKNDFINLAKDMSVDVSLRRKIVLEYADDDSQEVTALFNFLRVSEQYEQIKKIVDATLKKIASSK